MIQQPLHDDWGTAVEVVPKRSPKPCAACGLPFTPANVWDQRCSPCRTENRPKIKLIVNKEFKGVQPPPARTRFYSGSDETTGKKYNYPSVTSILHPDGIDYPEELLQQYASRGTIVHKKIEIFLETGVWPRLLETNDPRLQKDFETVSNGSLNLSIDACNFFAWHERYRHLFTFDKLEALVVNHAHKFAGRTDCIGAYKGQPAILDWKTSSFYDEEKVANYFMQLSAYASIFPEIKYLVIVPLNPKDPRGYQEPFITRKVKGYFNQFLTLRKKFTQKYGI